MTLRVCLAGQFAVEAGGVSVPTAGVGPLGRLALAYLVTERNRPVRRDELAEVLWGELLPRSWETSVRVLVSKLRALLARAGLTPAEALTTQAGCYQLHLPESLTVDVEVASAGVTAAEAGAPVASTTSDSATAADRTRCGSFITILPRPRAERPYPREDARDRRSVYQPATMRKMLPRT